MIGIGIVELGKVGKIRVHESQKIGARGVGCGNIG